MKLSFLETFEEKFYFKTSHLFWHLLTGLGGLALVAGILILLWSITPSFKPGVKKPKYPEAVKVAAEEIKLKIQPPLKSKEVSIVPDTVAQPIVTEVAPPAVTAADPAEKAYNAALDSMKILLPPEKFRWDTKGHWQQDWYERKWVVDVYGINDRLRGVFSELNAGDFTSKKQLLNAYKALMALFPESLRFSVLKAAIEFSKTDVPTSVVNVNLLKASVANFTIYNSDYLEKFATFGKKNPRDGGAFIEYVNTIMPKFKPEIRLFILNTLINSYYNYFNLIEKQQEATNLFLEMLATFDAKDQVNALNEYYRAYLEKNYYREREIEQINREYESNLNHAESVVVHKKEVKAKYRGIGFKAVGASVVFIAFLALFLVVLSIQRNLKLMREEARAK
jgi:hypothetical protein